MKDFKLHLEDKNSLKKKPPRWKRAGDDGEIEITFPTGRRFRIEKFYEEDRNWNIRHKGWFFVLEWDESQRDWSEPADPWKPKGYAKEHALRQGQYDKRGKKVADYEDYFEYE